MNKKTDNNFRFQFGRMNKGINPLLLKENELSDCQNMIPGFQGWKQRRGSSALTTTSAIASGLRFKSLHQFRDLKDWTNVMVAHTYDSTNGERAPRRPFAVYSAQGRWLLPHLEGTDHSDNSEDNTKYPQHEWQCDRRCPDIAKQNNTEDDAEDA